MFKWLRELFVGKDNVQPTVEPPKPELVHTITVEPPKLEVVPKTIKTKQKKETWSEFPTTPKPTRKPRAAKPTAPKKPRAKKNANV